MGFSVNKLLYEEANIRLSCNRILRTGIEFKIENLSDSEILVILNIALDRIGYNSWGGGNDWTIGTHGTKVCIENGDLTYVEHASMSLNGTVFINGIGVEEFSVCDSNLGGTEHLEINLSEGTKQYSTDAQGLNFYIENKREVSITIGIWIFYYKWRRTNFRKCYNNSSTYERYIRIGYFGFNSDYFPSELNSFSGIMSTRINGKDLVDRFPVSYGNEISAESQNEEPVKVQTHESEKSSVEIAYEKACSLTVNNLVKKTDNFTGKTHYFYGNLIIQTRIKNG